MDEQTDDKTRKARRCALTTLNEAQTKLKPLQLNGALSDRNNAGTTYQCINLNEKMVLETGAAGFYLLVNGVIAIGDSKLAIDCTPAINPCAFPCAEKLHLLESGKERTRILA